MGKKLQTRTLPSRGTQTVADLAQIRVLAHPLRLRILGLLVSEPRTTKQVADLLGEKHTRLYHHVRALERAKMIRLTETRPKRGTIERYYQSTAALYQPAPSAFSAPALTKQNRSDLNVMLNTLLDTARVDLAGHFRKAGPDSGQGLLAARLVLHGLNAKVRRALKRKFLRALDELGKREEKRNARSGVAKGVKRAYAFTFLLCPTDDAAVGDSLTQERVPPSR